MGHPVSPICQSNCGALVRQNTMASKGRTERPCLRRVSIDPRVQGLGWVDAVRFLRDADLGFRHRVVSGRNQSQLELTSNLFGAGDGAIWQGSAGQSTGKTQADDRHDDQPKHPPHLMRMDRHRVVAKWRCERGAS
jgi:hypothetical protein